MARQRHWRSRTHTCGRLALRHAQSSALPHRLLHQVFQQQCVALHPPSARAGRARPGVARLLRADGWRSAHEAARSTCANTSSRRRAKALTRWMMPPALSDRRAMRCTTGSTSSWAMLWLRRRLSRPCGKAAERAQRLVELVRQGRGDLAHRHQAARGLQALLLQRGQLLGALALADVQHRTHPAHMRAIGRGQRRLVDQHVHQMAVAVFKLHLQAFAACALVQSRRRCRTAISSAWLAGQ
jgi:hypothetical protein